MRLRVTITGSVSGTAATPRTTAVIKLSTRGTLAYKRLMTKIKIPAAKAIIAKRFASLSIRF